MEVERRGRMGWRKVKGTGKKEVKEGWEKNKKKWIREEIVRISNTSE